jgi:hypothetical protein
MSDPDRQPPYFARSIELREPPRTLDAISSFTLIFDNEQMWVGAAAWFLGFPALWLGLVRRGHGLGSFGVVFSALLLVFGLWVLWRSFVEGLRRRAIVRGGRLLYAELVERSTRHVSRGPDVHIFSFEVELPAATASLGYRSAAPTSQKFRFDVEVEDPEGLGDEPKEPVLFHTDYPGFGLALDDRRLGLELGSDGTIRKRRGLMTSVACIAFMVAAVLYALFTDIAVA